MATAISGTNDHNSSDNTSILTIRLTDNSDLTHTQDYKLTIIPAGTPDILRIMLGTPKGSFETSNELGYAVQKKTYAPAGFEDLIQQSEL